MFRRAFLPALLASMVCADAAALDVRVATPEDPASRIHGSSRSQSSQNESMPAKMSRASGSPT